MIAIDGLAIIVNPRNPPSTLNTEQLAQIFNGEVSTWEALGGTGGAIHLYARMINPAPSTPSGNWC